MKNKVGLSLVALVLLTIGTSFFFVTANSNWKNPSASAREQVSILDLPTSIVVDTEEAGLILKKEGESPESWLEGSTIAVAKTIFEKVKDEPISLNVYHFKNGTLAAKLGCQIYRGEPVEAKAVLTVICPTVEKEKVLVTEFGQTGEGETNTFTRFGEFYMFRKTVK